jgi:hypothetical protein
MFINLAIERRYILLQIDLICEKWQMDLVEIRCIGVP